MIQPRCCSLEEVNPNSRSVFTQLHVHDQLNAPAACRASRIFGQATKSALAFSGCTPSVVTSACDHRDGPNWTNLRELNAMTLYRTSAHGREFGCSLSHLVPGEAASFNDSIWTGALRARGVDVAARMLCQSRSSQTKQTLKFVCTGVQLGEPAMIAWFSSNLFR